MYSAVCHEYVPYGFQTTHLHVIVIYRGYRDSCVVHHVLHHTRDVIRPVNWKDKTWPICTIKSSNVQVKLKFIFEYFVHLFFIMYVSEERKYIAQEIKIKTETFWTGKVKSSMTLFALMTYPQCCVCMYILYRIIKVVGHQDFYYLSSLILLCNKMSFLYSFAL